MKGLSAELKKIWHQFYKTLFFFKTLQVELGKCDIDFFNFRHCQVWNFQILNLSERDPNLMVNFWNHWKRKQKLTKYNKIEQNQSIIVWNFVRCHEILLNFTKSHNFCFILQKSKRIMQNFDKHFGKFVKYSLNYF